MTIIISYERLLLLLLFYKNLLVLFRFQIRKLQKDQKISKNFFNQMNLNLISIMDGFFL